MIVSSLAYTIAFGFADSIHFLRIVVGSVVIEFLLCGFIIATVGRCVSLPFSFLPHPFSLSASLPPSASLPLYLLLPLPGSFPLCVFLSMIMNVVLTCPSCILLQVYCQQVYARSANPQHGTRSRMALRVRYSLQRFFPDLCISVCGAILPVSYTHWRDLPVDVAI